MGEIMAALAHQIDDLIAPAVARSSATAEVIIGTGVIGRTGEMAARLTSQRRALVMADSAGYAAGGPPVVDALRAAGFDTDTLVIPNDPLPKASVEEAERFRAALAADADLLPVSVGSGVINDLVKYAAFETERRYITVATAASMDGYTSAGAPVAREGFKITIPTRAPMGMLADLDVLAAAPAEMNGWGYGDLAGKIPAGGDWIVADALGVEAIDDVAWPLVQDHLRGWLATPAGIAQGDPDTVAGLFVGLTAVGFAMEFHGSSRPASGADHQIAHLWEMEGHVHQGRKVSHGAAVAIGCVASLALFDWLLQQDLAALDTEQVVAKSPGLEARIADLRRVLPDQHIAAKAEQEVRAKAVTPAHHAARLARLKACWPDLRTRLSTHLYRADQMAAMLTAAGTAAYAREIGVSGPHLLRTLRAAAYIRQRYTVLDLLHDTGLTEAALRDVMPKLDMTSRSAAE